VQPLRQQLTIYVYGAKVGWKVAVDSTAQITKVIPHGPKIVQQDPALAPGEQHQTAFAHDGATTILHRTILKPNGDLTVDKIPTTYQPWQAVVEEGSVAPTPRATRKPPRRQAHPLPPPGPLPLPPQRPLHHPP
jgi:hypothetical protein